MSSEAKMEIQELRHHRKQIVNIQCDSDKSEETLPNAWKDCIDHKCMDIKSCLSVYTSATTEYSKIEYPTLYPGWTSLHAAAASARSACIRLLLAAGADPNICDQNDRTSLDVAGSNYYKGIEIKSKNFTELIKMLVAAGSRLNRMKSRNSKMDTPIHTAVELNNIDCIKELLDAGATISCCNSVGDTPLHICVKKKLTDALALLAYYEYQDPDNVSAMIDVKNKEGYTVLHAAIIAEWLLGICTSLELGADVTIKGPNGETPIHTAAELGNIFILDRILYFAKKENFIDCQNDEGETPLFKAIMNNNLPCVETILKAGASIEFAMPGNVNALHIATEHGNINILRFLLEYKDGIAQKMINSLTTPDQKGLGPIHFAILNGNIDCLQYLLSKKADIRLRTTEKPYKSSTPLHLTAMKNFEDGAKEILNYDRKTVDEKNGVGWYPLHTASHFGSKEVILLLLREGADLSRRTDDPKEFRKTGIDMIMHNLSKPTEFVEEIFDSYICVDSQNVFICEVSVDYRILVPEGFKQMNVMKALLESCNNQEQTKLLIHPLVESFLYLKWKALLPFFYVMIAVYALFVASVTVFVIAVFFYNDTYTIVPPFFNLRFWGSTIYSTIFLIVLQELLYMNLLTSRYFFHRETWIKLCSILLGAALPSVVANNSLATSDGPRHLATCVLLLSWIELMFLLSRFPNWGYYLIMFAKVAVNVVKIILAFSCLVIGFSLTFMIQFHTQIPFHDPWAAIVKTMVMMTSEFDYGSLFDKENTKQLGTSLIVVQIIFVIFLLLVAIVLMNLMVGVAVNDINNLEMFGNVKRLAKQVEFISHLDRLVYTSFSNFVLLKWLYSYIRNRGMVPTILKMYPGKKVNKSIPLHITNGIIDKALQKVKLCAKEDRKESFQNKVDEMYKSTVAQTELREIQELKRTVNEFFWVQKNTNNNIIESFENLHEELTTLRRYFICEMYDVSSKLESIERTEKRRWPKFERKKDNL